MSKSFKRGMNVSKQRNVSRFRDFNRNDEFRGDKIIYEDSSLISVEKQYYKRSRGLHITNKGFCASGSGSIIDIIDKSRITIYSRIKLIFKDIELNFLGNTYFGYGGYEDKNSYVVKENKTIYDIVRDSNMSYKVFTSSHNTDTYDYNLRNEGYNPSYLKIMVADFRECSLEDVDYILLTLEELEKTRNLENRLMLVEVPYNNRRTTETICDMFIERNNKLNTKYMIGDTLIYVIEL